MVKLENILNFTNILCLFGFLIGVVHNFVMISKKYNSLSLIVNLYLIAVLISLCVYRMNNENIETFKYLIYTGTYLHLVVFLC